jgi:hypothetical protein
MARGPPVAGLAVEHLSPRAVFGLTEAACTAALAAAAVAWRTRQPADRATGTRPHQRPEPTAAHAPGDLVSAQCQAQGRGQAIAEQAAVRRGSPLTLPFSVTARASWPITPAVPHSPSSRSSATPRRA